MGVDTAAGEIDTAGEGKRLMAVHRGPTLLATDGSSSLRTVSKDVLELKVDGESVRSDQIRRTEVTGKWLGSIDNDGKRTFLESGGQYFRKILQSRGYFAVDNEENGSFDTIQRHQKVDEDIERYFEDLTARDVPVYRYDVTLPGGVPLYYYEIGRVLPGLSKEMPRGLISTLEGWMQIRNKLDIKDVKDSAQNNHQMVVFDVHDYTTNGSGGAKRIIPQLYERVGLHSSGTCVVTSKADCQQYHDLHKVAVVDNDWVDTNWHEQGHKIGESFLEINNDCPKRSREGFAVLCSQIAEKDFGNVCATLRRKYGMSIIDERDIYRLFSDDPNDVIFQEQTEQAYGLSGAFMWYVFDKLGARGIKRFCALIDGRYGDPLARYEPNCKGKVLLALEKAADTTEGFNAAVFVDDFVNDYSKVIGPRRPPLREWVDTGDWSPWPEDAEDGKNSQDQEVKE